MTNVYWMTTLCMVACVAMAQDKKEEPATSIFDAARKSRLSVNLRAGYEYSSTDDNRSPAQNFSLRTRAAFETAKYHGFSVFAQGLVMNNFIEEHRFPGGGDPSRDIVADPDGARVHQAYLDYTGLADTRFRGGRQEIIFDDARLIGDIGWRQFAQSFDGVSVKNTSIDNIALSMAWFDQVNTIFNTSVEFKHIGMVNAKYSSKPVNVALFTYMLDAEQGNRDSITYGARTNGQVAAFDYDVTLAKQDDFANSSGHNAEMANCYAGAKVGSFHVGAGYSLLSGAEGNDGAFDTLFSTAHLYNGWADQFLATNGGNLTNGLEDTYVDIKTKLNKTIFMLRYHSFSVAEEVTHTGEYGDELDFMIKHTFKIADSNPLTLIAQFALYNETNENGGSNPTTDEFLTSVRLIYNF